MGNIRTSVGTTIHPKIQFSKWHLQAISHNLWENGSWDVHPLTSSSKPPFFGSMMVIFQSVFFGERHHVQVSWYIVLQLYECDFQNFKPKNFSINKIIMLKMSLFFAFTSSCSMKKEDLNLGQSFIYILRVVPLSSNSGKWRFKEIPD